MEWSGFALLILVGVGIISTGLPAAFVLIAVAGLGAVLGLASGTIPFSLLSALPGRLINLFDNDLLQALPLYVTMGLLLGRLPLADALYRTSNAILPKRASAPLVSGMLLGALLGPTNGSVGASVLGLSRVVAPRLTAEGVPAATRDAVIAVASTLGVLVPPSLVLILLSDAMLNAHTYAVTQTGRNDRVINTQDVFHAALVPAAIFLTLCLLLAWRAGRSHDLSPVRERLTSQEGILAGFALCALLALLGGVAIASTGALFSLLIAATTFTLILRLLGTDRLVDNLVAGIPGGDVLATAVILGVIGLCAFVLDAFEIIFVIVPIVIPPLLVRVADARWVAVLVLLTLQSSFLLPPFGYALMMVRGVTKNPAPFRTFVRALVPFLLAQWMLLIVVLLVPKLVHVGENAAESTRAPAVPVSNEEIDRRMREMLPPPPAIEPK